MGNLRVITALIDHGVDINFKDRWGGTGLADAIREGHRDIAVMLCEAGGRLAFEEETAAGTLCELARLNDLEKMKLLLKGGCDANAADYDKRTCLHLAASTGNAHVVEALIEFKADINFQDRWGGTPLVDAISGGHHKLARLIREHGGELKWDEAKESTELCELAKAGDLERVKLLLDCGCCANAANYDSRACLHLACSVGNLRIVEVLKEHGAELNKKDRWGGTGLADAIREGHREVAHYLCAAGGKLEFDEETAAATLCELAKSGDVDKVQLVLAGGCDANAADYDLRTCLHLAASTGNSHIVEKLVQGHADITALDRWGATPLSDAVREGHSKVARTLKSMGAELCWDDDRAASELSALVRAGDIERLLLLLDLGCNPDAANPNNSRTCLHIAATLGNLRIVQSLQEHGADISAKDRWGGTALANAIREGHREVAQFLINSGGELSLDEENSAGTLCELAKSGDLDKLKLLLAAGCDANAADYDRRTISTLIGFFFRLIKCSTSI